MFVAFAVFFVTIWCNSSVTTTQPLTKQYSSPHFINIKKRDEFDCKMSYNYKISGRIYFSQQIHLQDTMIFHVLPLRFSTKKPFKHNSACFISPDEEKHFTVNVYLIWQLFYYYYLSDWFKQRKVIVSSPLSRHDWSKADFLHHFLCESLYCQDIEHLYMYILKLIMLALISP